MRKIQKITDTPIRCSFIAVVLFLCLFSSSVNAQGVAPSTYDVEKHIYPEDKRGCGMDLAMFTVFSKSYKAGQTARSAGVAKVLQPLIQDMYDLIKEKGLSGATLLKIGEYKDCVDHAPLNEDAGREYDQALIHKSCGKLSAVILDTLMSIKKRKKVDSVLRKYERKHIDMTGTSYEKIEDPALLFVGTLYKISKEQEYKDVVSMGVDLVVGCYQ